MNITQADLLVQCFVLVQSLREEWQGRGSTETMHCTVHMPLLLLHGNTAAAVTLSG